MFPEKLTGSQASYSLCWLTITLAPDVLVRSDRGEALTRAMRTWGWMSTQYTCTVQSLQISRALQRTVWPSHWPRAEWGILEKYSQVALSGHYWHNLCHYWFLEEASPSVVEIPHIPALFSSLTARPSAPLGQRETTHNHHSIERASCIFG